MHRHFKLNGKRVNIASILVDSNDVVELEAKSRKSPKFKAIFENFSSRTYPVWMEVDRENCKIKVLRRCNREEVSLEVEEHLIVELYSK